MDWQALLKTIAPWIGTAIGGPLGGMAMTAAASALGISQPTTDKLKAALAGITPEQSLALQSAEHDFAVKMQELGYKNVADLEAIAAGDRDSARKMQMSTPSWVPAALSIAVTFGYFVVLIGMMTKAFDIADSQLALVMLGSLTTAWASVLSYWFGTTRDSGDKSKLLAQSAPAK